MERMPEGINRRWKEKEKEIEQKLAELGLTGVLKTETMRGAGTELNSYQKFQFEPEQLKRIAAQENNLKVKNAVEELIGFRETYGPKPNESYIFEMELEEELVGIYLPHVLLTWEMTQFEKLQAKKELTSEQIAELSDGMEHRGFKQEMMEITLKQVFNPAQAMDDVKELLQREEKKLDFQKECVMLYLEAKMEPIIEEANVFLKGLPHH